jgi:hypothetical protein
MTREWAATNTLRTAIRPFDYDDTPYNNADVVDALALVEAALDAAERVAPGAKLRTLPGTRGVFEDEMDALTAALRAVREGKE